MAQSSTDASHVARTTSSKRFNKSDFLPDRKSAFLDSDDEYELFAWLKNSFMLP